MRARVEGQGEGGARVGYSGEEGDIIIIIMIFFLVINNFIVQSAGGPKKI